VLWNSPLRIFLGGWGIFSSLIFMIWPAHPSLLILILSTVFYISVKTTNFAITSSAPVPFVFVIHYS
jgi:hypothetical protein